MKRYLIPIMIILVLVSGASAGCGQDEQTAKLITYLDREQLISERHIETLQAINNAMDAISSEAEKPSPDDPSKTQLEAIELPRGHTGNVTLKVATAEDIIKALTTPKTTPEPIIPSGLKEVLTSGIDTLDWALERMEAEIRDYQSLNPPPEAATYHGLTVEAWLKQQAIYNDIRSNYRSLLSYGYSDVEALNRVEKELTEMDRLWSLAQHEWEEIVGKVGK